MGEALPILQAAGIISGIAGSQSSSRAASSAASSQKDALAQQKEWLNKIWKYYEPELQRKQQMNAMLDPYRNQASTWLASMTGMKTAPQYGGTPAASVTPVTPPAATGTPPPAAGGNRPITPWTGGLPGQSNSPYGGQPMPISPRAGSGWLEAFRNRAAAAAPTTGAAAGIGASPSTQLPTGNYMGNATPGGRGAEGMKALLAQLVQAAMEQRMRQVGGAGPNPMPGPVPTTGPAAGMGASPLTILPYGGNAPTGGIQVPGGGGLWGRSRPLAPTLIPSLPIAPTPMPPLPIAPHPLVPTTGPAAGIGASPWTTLGTRPAASRTASGVPMLGGNAPATGIRLPSGNTPATGIRVPGGGVWGKKKPVAPTQPAPAPGTAAPGTAAPGAPDPGNLGKSTLPYISYQGNVPGTGPVLAPTTPAASASVVPAPVTGGMTEQQAAIAAAKDTGPNAPPWYFQVPQLTAALQSALQGTPDWQKPFTPQQQGALTNLSDVNIGDQYNQRNTAMQQMMAQRGLAPVGGTSSMDTSAQVGLQNWLQNQQANQQSQMALAGMQRGDQLRSENLGNLVNQNQLEGGQRSEGRGNYNALMNFLTGQTAAQPDASSLYGGVSGYGNVANGYGNMAGMYGNMASGSAQDFGNMLAQLLGNQGSGTSIAGFTPVGGPVNWAPA